MLKILVPTDFSIQARYAAELACQLAEGINASITFLHIVELPSTTVVDPSGVAIPVAFNQEYHQLITEQGEKELAAFAREYAQCNVKQQLLVGNPYENIMSSVEDWHADLIIMGTKGASGLKEFFIGSNAQKVVRKATCPVITLAQRTDASNLHDIVYATDLTDASKHLIRALRKLQELFKATVHIVRINTPNNFKSDSVATKLLQNIAKGFSLTNYTINTYNHEVEAEGIVAFAKTKNAGLIALGTHGRTGLKSLLSGSLAESLVNHTSLPIWSCNFRPLG